MEERERERERGGEEVRIGERDDQGVIGSSQLLTHAQ